MPVTVNGGMSMTSWFDMADIPVLAETADDEASMEAYGLKVLNGLIDEQVAAGIEPSRIVVGGFSQGGCTALLCSLRRQETLAGVLSISGWLPSYVATEEAIRAGANGTARPPSLILLRRIPRTSLWPRSWRNWSSDSPSARSFCGSGERQPSG